MLDDRDVAARSAVGAALERERRLPASCCVTSSRVRACVGRVRRSVAVHPRAWSVGAVPQHAPRHATAHTHAGGARVRRPRPSTAGVRAQQQLVLQAQGARSLTVAQGALAG